MELYIGGYSQGKLKYVCENKHKEIYQIYDGAVEEGRLPIQEKIIFNHFHQWFCRHLIQGENPEEIMDTIISDHSALIIISDEIGNGVIPMDKGQREYRERLGRYLCRLAKKAERVERIICGIGQRIV